MKAKKLIGKIFKTIGILIVVAIIAVVAIIIKQEKDSAADCETMEEVVELLEQALATPMGSSAVDAFGMTSYGEPHKMKFVIRRGGCDIFVLNGIGDPDCVDDFRNALDSINPNWRTDYTSKRDVMYEIFIHGGTGEIKFGIVPSGFSK